MQMVRNSAEYKEVDIMRWIIGQGNISDAHTKSSTGMSSRINEICKNGLLTVKLSIGRMV